VSKFGSLGTGNGQLVSPRGIAIDSSGNLWVVDLGNNRVQEFNPKGEYLTQFGSAGTGNGQFNQPYGIATNPSDDLWIADTFNNRVTKWSR